MSIGPFNPRFCTLMGYSSRAENLVLCIGAPGAVLNDLGMSVDGDAAQANVQATMNARSVHSEPIAANANS
jgi:hypothetical protein